jgi:hypothetical protein
MLLRLEERCGAKEAITSRYQIHALLIQDL